MNKIFIKISFFISIRKILIDIYDLIFKINEYKKSGIDILNLKKNYIFKKMDWKSEDHLGYGEIIFLYTE